MTQTPQPDSVLQDWIAALTSFARSACSRLASTRPRAPRVTATGAKSHGPRMLRSPETRRALLESQGAEQAYSFIEEQDSALG